jgi:GNAT superfamily N-acetyltransferase
MIRPATFDDIPRMVQLGEQLHGMSSYAPLSFDRAKVAHHLAGLIAGHGVIFVAERDGEVVGGLAGGITEQWFGPDRVAFDYSLFIEPGKRHGITAARLIRAFVEWARIRGARQVTIGITTGLEVESTARLYESQGFVRCGDLFRMEV